MPPKVLIVPGFWEGSAIFEPLVAALKGLGFEAHVLSHSTTGTKSPGNPTVAESVATLNADLAKHVDAAGDEPVVALLHSAGGVMGSAALQGLGTQQRKEAGKKGGVARIIYFASIIVPEGNWESNSPSAIESRQMEQSGLVVQEDGQMMPTNPTALFFNDVTEEEAALWLKTFRGEPWDGWGVPLTYMGWREIPSTYILCENDGILAPPMQEAFAKQAGSESIVKINSGHMAQVTKTDELAKLVKEIVDAVA